MRLNKGKTPDGREFVRTEGVLCYAGSHTFAGHISEIETGDLDEVVVAINMMTGVLDSMDSAASPLEPQFKTPVDRETGFYHHSTRVRRGEKGERPRFLFCFADEEPNWIAEHDQEWRDREAAGLNPPPIAQSAPAAAPEVPATDPRDSNQDGTVSKAEAKEWKKDHPKG